MHTASDIGVYDSLFVRPWRGPRGRSGAGVLATEARGRQEIACAARLRRLALPVEARR